MGNNSTVNSAYPVQVSGLTGAQSVSGGYLFSLALTNDGAVWGWGSNSNGQLGDNSTTQRLTPVQVKGEGGAGTLSGVAMVSAGWYHSLAVDNTQTAWAWGQNTYGQLGDASGGSRLAPGKVKDSLNVPLAGVGGVAAGAYHSLAAAGSLPPTPTPGPTSTNTAAPTSTSTPTNTPTPTGSATPTATSTPTVTSAPTATSAPTNTPTPTATVFPTLAATPTRASLTGLQGWGSDASGQVGDGTMGAGACACRDVPVSVLAPMNEAAGVSAVGGYHSLGVNTAGSVYAWGRNSSGQLGNNATTDSASPVQVVGPGGVGFLSGATGVAGGWYYSLALKSDGTVWVWGSNSNGQLGNGSAVAQMETPVQVETAPGVPLTGVVAIAGGAYHALALKSDGTVWAWGGNAYGQLGDESGTQQSRAVQVHGLGGVVAIGAGAHHSLAVAQDGTVWAWGRNNSGQLGNNSTTDSPVPVQVSSLSSVQAVSGGYLFSLALKSDGTVWAWGSNSNGQLGDGTNAQKLTPVQATGLSGVAMVSAGWYHSLAVKADPLGGGSHQVWSWGQNTYGQLGRDYPTDAWSPGQVTTVVNAGGVGAGAYHSLAGAGPLPPPPAPTITSAPPSYTSNTTSATFEFTDSQSGVTFICQLDTWPSGVCTSPTSYSGAGTLTVGSHTFSVQAKFSSNGLLSGAATHTWTIDVTPPVVSLSSPVTGTVTTDSTPTFSGTAGILSGDSSSVTVKVYPGTSAVDPFTWMSTATVNGGGAYSATPSSALADGTYTAQTTQTDAAGNTANSSTPTFVIDTVAPPAPTITGQPNSPTGSTSATFNFTDTEAGVTFVCSLDGAVYGSCSSGVTYSSLSDGSHTFNMKAQDAAGNQSGAASYGWTVDSTTPTVTLTTTVGSPTNASPIPVTATFSKSMTGFDLTDVTVGNGMRSNFVAVSTTTYTFDLTPFMDGAVTVDVAAGVAVDEAGNGNTAAAQLSRVSDRTAPSLTLTSPANGGLTNNTLVPFTGVGGTAPWDPITATVKVYSGPDTSGAPLQTLTTTAGSALQFNSSLSGVAKTSAPATTAYQSFNTLEAWVRWGGVTAADQLIVHDGNGGNGGNSGYGLYIIGSTRGGANAGKLHLHLGGQWDYETPATLTVGTWQHVAVVHKPEWTVYVDGAPVGTTVIPSTPRTRVTSLSSVVHRAERRHSTAPSTRCASGPWRAPRPRSTPTRACG